MIEYEDERDDDGWWDGMDDRFLSFATFARVGPLLTTTEQAENFAGTVVGTRMCGRL